MNPLHQIILALACLVASTHLASARIVTLVHSAPNTVTTNTEFEVSAGDSAEIVSWVLNETYLTVQKDGVSIPYLPSQPNYSSRFVIAGPAKFTLTSNAGCCVNVKTAFVTLKVEPESFPPDKTIIIPDGATGARIAMEVSTNLVNWTVATNGFYTGTNGAKFFRVVGERVP